MKKEAFIKLIVNQLGDYFVDNTISENACSLNNLQKSNKKEGATEFAKKLIDNL